MGLAAPPARTAEPSTVSCAEITFKAHRTPGTLTTGLAYRAENYRALRSCRSRAAVTAGGSADRSC